MSDIRGLVIQSRLDYVEQEKGNNIYQEILQKLSNPVRLAIGEQVFPTNLYPFHLLRDLDTALGESIDQPLEKTFREIGTFYATRTLDRYFFNYLEAKNIHKFLAQMEKLYLHLWNFGIYEYKKTGANRATVKLSYDEDVQKSYCWFMQAFLIKGGELCGGSEVVLDEAQCEAESGDSCVYHLRWKHS